MLLNYLTVTNSLYLLTYKYFIKPSHIGLFLKYNKRNWDKAIIWDKPVVADCKLVLCPFVMQYVDTTESSGVIL